MNNTSGSMQWGSIFVMTTKGLFGSFRRRSPPSRYRRIFVKMAANLMRVLFIFFGVQGREDSLKWLPYLRMLRTYSTRWKAIRQHYRPLISKWRNSESTLIFLIKDNIFKTIEPHNLPWAPLFITTSVWNLNFVSKQRENGATREAHVKCFAFAVE